MDWQEKQDSSMVEPQARDLEVRVRVPVQIHIFLLKFNKLDIKYFSSVWVKDVFSSDLLLL